MCKNIKYVIRNNEDDEIIKINIILLLKAIVLGVIFFLFFIVFVRDFAVLAKSIDYRVMFLGFSSQFYLNPHDLNFP